MICYRDQTFCDFYRQCDDGTTCPRALTPDVQQRAADAGFPICRFLNKPTCFVTDNGAWVTPQPEEK